LRKEGEAPDPAIRRAPADAGSGQTQSGNGSDHSDEPQWGTKKPDGQESPQDQQKPPLFL